MNKISQEPIKLGPEGRFSFGGESFVVDMSRGGRRPSDSDGFTIVKNEHYFRIYELLAARFSPRSILELGIFQGGSYVLLDKLFKPRRMSAVDINAEPVAPLLHYAAKTENRFVHFSTSQCDREVLPRIVREELADELDLVVDDASHSYEQTKASFELLFPLLRPSGLYIIEDWPWAHNPRYQSTDAPRADRRALSNLLFEQIMLMGSTSLIAEIRIWKPLYLICKRGPIPKQADQASTSEGSVFDQILSRGKKWELI
jgi:predicted O-methyltransferase YrrM